MKTLHGPLEIELKDGFCGIISCSIGWANGLSAVNRADVLTYRNRWLNEPMSSLMQVVICKSKNELVSTSSRSGFSHNASSIFLSLCEARRCKPRRKLSVTSELKITP